MIKTLNFILVCTSLVGLVSVYALKFHVEDTASAKSALERQIERQQASLSLLEAEWAYLNQPTHVAPIIARHNEVLMLQPTKPTQFAAIDSLPMRPVVQLDTTALDVLFESLESGIDPIEQLIEASENGTAL
ncbi:MAG: cell division protein FtsL [Devosia sp.]|jgi:hypothetical protein|uniref:cell division protein FtsL n=1 Tax=Devosia sp. TaxID=1871048 RepID=UPI0037BEC21B